MADEELLDEDSFTFERPKEFLIEESLMGMDWTVDANTSRARGTIFSAAFLALVPLRLFRKLHSPSNEISLNSDIGS